MITNNLPLKSLSIPSSGGINNSMSASGSQHSYGQINSFIANILSKAFLSLFADFYSPLKHPSIR